MRLAEWKKEKGITSLWLIAQARHRGVDITPSRMTRLMQCRVTPTRSEYDVIRNITRRKVYSAGEDFYQPPLTEENHHGNFTT